MNTIVLFFSNGEQETYEGSAQVLSNGVIEITQQVEQSQTMIATLAQSKVIGIPIRLLDRYEIS